MSEMSTIERQDSLLQTLEQRGRLAVADICTLFTVSEATARRDLDTLAREGKIQRFHGGALFVRKATPEEPIMERAGAQENEKERIGAAAAQLVADGDTVFLGSGTTVMQVARCLLDKKITVITNSLPVVNLFANVPDANLIMIGGLFRASERSFIGHTAETALSDLRADKVIIGSRSISLEHGLTSEYLPETMMDRKILQMGQQIIVVADHTKFGRVSTVHLAPIHKVQVIVTDSKTDPAMLDLLAKKKIAVVVA